MSSLCSLLIARGDAEMLRVLLHVMRKRGALASAPEARALNAAAAQSKTEVGGCRYETMCGESLNCLLAWSGGLSMAICTMSKLNHTFSLTQSTLAVPQAVAELLNQPWYSDRTLAHVSVKRQCDSC